MGEAEVMLAALESRLLAAIEKKINDSLEKRLDLFADSFLGSIRDANCQDEKAEVLRKIEHIDVKLDTLSEKLEGLKASCGATQSQAKLPDAPSEELKCLLLAKMDELPKLVGAKDILELVPKISQLQNNLDNLLTGENEANEVIERLLPTVSKLQKDFEAFSRQSDLDMKKLKDEILPKIQESVNDCYYKTCDIKENGKEALEKLDRVQRKLPYPRGSQPKAKKSYSEDGLTTYYHDESSDEDVGSRRRDVETPHNSSSKPEVNAESPESISSDLRDQLVRMNSGLSELMCEMRRAGVLPSSDSSAPRGRNRPAFAPRGRFGAYQYKKAISGTKWTYDEHGNREQKSDDEASVRRTSPMRSRSRSSSSGGSRRESRRSAKRRASRSSSDGETRNMEQRIASIDSKVNQVLSKMIATGRSTATQDSSKTQESVDVLAAKVEALNTTVGSLSSQIVEKLNQEKLELTGRKRKAKEDGISGDNEAISSEMSAKLLELTTVMESLRTRQTKEVEKVAAKLNQVYKMSKDYGEASLQMITLLKSVETSTKSDIVGLLKDVRQVLGASDDSKRHANDTFLVEKEDSLNISKILDLVEDLKQGSRERENASQHAPPDAISVIQIYDTLAELRSMITANEENCAKNFNDVKGDCAKMLSKLSELLKSKANEKSLVRLQTVVEEIKKNEVADGKTLSSMNTLLQGLRASHSAHETKLSSLKESAESARNVPEQVQKVNETLGELLKSQAAVVQDVKASAAVMVKAEENIVKRIKSSSGKATEETSRAIISLEKKLSECASAGAKDTVEKFTSALAELRAALLQSIEDVRAQPHEDSDVSSKNALLSTANNLESRVVGLSTEILDSIEDIKMLSSSAPNAIHDILPKIDCISAGVKQFNEDFSKNMAALEENLCANFEKSFQASQQLAQQEIYQRFDVIESRLAVVKHYIKHNRASSGGPIQSEGTDDFRDEYPKLSRSLDEAVKLARQILQEQAKSYVVEEQFEALAHTLLQPMQESRLQQEKILLELNSPPASSSSKGHAFSRAEERVLTGQELCLQTLKELKTLTSSINATLATSSGDTFKMDAVTKMVEYLKRIKKAQNGIMKQADQSIALQKLLNDIYKMLESIQKTLGDRDGRDLDSGSVSALCHSLSAHIGEVVDLEGRLSVPRAQSNDDMRTLIEMCIPVLNQLLSQECQRQETVTKKRSHGAAPSAQRRGKRSRRSCDADSDNDGLDGTDEASDNASSVSASSSGSKPDSGGGNLPQLREAPPVSATTIRQAHVQAEEAQPAKNKLPGKKSSQKRQ